MFSGNNIFVSSLSAKTRLKELPFPIQQVQDRNDRSYPWVVELTNRRECTFSDWMQYLGTGE